MTITATDRLLLETPEGIRVELPLAGPVSRFLAWLIDSLVIASASSTIGQILNRFSVLSPDFITALSVLLYFVISVGYGLALEWQWEGQTVGKRVLGLRVIDAAGGKLTFAQVALRNLLRFLDSVPGLYLVGGTALLFTRHAQRLGDLVADTVVLRKRPAQLPALDEDPQDQDRYNSFLELPHEAARLRQRATPALAALATEALLRRNDLEPTARLALFAALAARFRDLHAFPAELTQSLTPERYVRNARAVLDAKHITRRPPR